MSKPETKLWEQLRDKKAIPGVYERIENYASSGTPDVSGVYRLDYWIELKASTNRIKESPLVPNDKRKSYLLRDSQIAWHNERGPLGSIIFVIVKYIRKIIIYKWYDENLYIKIEEFKSPFNYEKIKETLKNWILE